MSSFVLRILAMAAMLADHVGYRFANELPGSLVILLRSAGRIAMPLFCFLVAEGLFHTRNVKKYLLRMGVFSLVSEIPFDLFSSGRLWEWRAQNVGFTLLLGLLGILFFDAFAARGKKGMALAAILACAAGAFLIGSDYLFFGVYYVFVFYLFRGDRRLLVPALAAGVFCLGASAALSSGWRWGLTQAAALGALLPVFLYSGKRGPGGRAARWAFYAFYPAHLLLLYALYEIL